MAVKEQVTWQEGGKWPLKNGHMTAKKRKHLRTTRMWQRILVGRILVIRSVVERSLEIACMAFCTWNKTLKGNTLVYYSCAYLYWFKVCWFYFFCFGFGFCFLFFVQGNTSVSKHSKEPQKCFSTIQNRSSCSDYCSPAAAASWLRPYERLLDKCVLQSSLPLVALHLNPAQRHNPKPFPFKGESD